MIRSVLGQALTRAGRWWRRAAVPGRGDLALRREPVSRKFGLDRGTPIDRYYIAAFLARQATDIRGRVLEIGDREYTRRFGGDRVTQSDVLHAVAGNPQATLLGDLATGEGVPRKTFDCVLLTQTLPFIYDVRAAVGTVREALRPGGVVLATVSGISQISRYDMDRWGDYWRFTDRSARRVFDDVFGAAQVAVETFGNVLAAAAFLQGLALEDLDRAALDRHDPDYQVLIAVRALRREDS
jgi:SAM-dependent methyltransferase